MVLKEKGTIMVLIKGKRCHYGTKLIEKEWKKEVPLVYTK